MKRNASQIKQGLQSEMGETVLKKTCNFKRSYAKRLMESWKHCQGYFPRCPNSKAFCEKLTYANKKLLKHRIEMFSQSICSEIQICNLRDVSKRLLCSSAHFSPKRHMRKREIYQNLDRSTISTRVQKALTANSQHQMPEMAGTMSVL